MRHVPAIKSLCMPAGRAILIGGAAMMMYCAAVHAASSPVFRCNPARTGVQEETALPPLAQVWQTTDRTAYAASPVVYKDTVYCGGRDSSIRAWDNHTGALRWRFVTGGWVDATACVTEDTVYVPCRDKTLYALDRLTGAVRWQAVTGSADCSSPVYDQGKLYLISGPPKRTAYCYDALTGSLLRSYPLSQCGFSSPALSGQSLCFGTNDGCLSCLDLQSGTTVWSKATQGGILYSCAAISNGIVYAVSGGDERHLFAFDLRTGAQNWQSVEIDTVTSSVSSVAAASDAVYLVSTFNALVDGEPVSELWLMAFDLSGSLRWRTKVGWPHPSDIISSPVIAGGVVYVCSGDGNLYAVNAVLNGPDAGKYIEPGTGALTAAATGYFLCTDPSQTPAVVGTPAIANGRIYIGSFDGTFSCLSAQKAAHITSPDTGDTVTNGASVTGSLTGLLTDEYTLEYGQGTDPSSWHAIHSGTSAVQSNELGQWQTSELPDGSYSLRIKDTADGTPRALNRVIVNNSPGGPSNLSARDTAFDDGSGISLSWALSTDDGAANNDVTGYRVYRSSFNGAYALRGTAAAGVARFTDTTVTPYTTYYYIVTAVDAASESVPSNAASAYSLVDGVRITPHNGGTITLTHDGLTTEVVFEPGSVAQDVFAGIAIPDTVPDTDGSPDMQPTGVCREFGLTPAGTTLLKPVTIKIPYTDAQAQGMDIDNLRICWWDEEKGKWRVVNTSQPRVERNRVWAVIPHFSLYRIMEYVPGREPLLQADRVYTHPNPARGDTVHFKFYLGDEADVTIDIYSVAGDLVAHLEQPDNMAGIVSEIAWPCGSVASGVYVYRVQARSAGQTRSVKKKMAIIH